MEKTFNEIFMQSPGSRYLAMQVKLLRRASTSINRRIGSTLWSKKQKGVGNLVGGSGTWE